MVAMGEQDPCDEPHPRKVPYATEKDESVRVRIFNIEHACLGAGVQTHQTANHQSWLLREIPNLIIVSGTTKPIDIVNAVQLH